MSLGRGTVGKLHGCLYVPALQKNLISVSHVCKDLGGYFIMDDTKCQFIDKRSQKVMFSCSITSDLYSTMDLTWLGIYSATLAPHFFRKTQALSYQNAENNKFNKACGLMA